MATFYTSSTNERDVMPNLYTRDSGETLYPESSVGGNMMYFNFASSGSFSEMLASGNESQPNCGAFPVISQESSMNGHAYNAWRDGRNEMLFMRTNSDSMDGENELVRSSIILNGQALSLQQSNFSNVQGQGLSLSLGTQIPMSSFKYQPWNSDVSMLSPHQSSGTGESCRDDNSKNKLLHANASTYGLTNLTSNISNSKYLKAAQNLLDEVVNVQKALKQKASKSQSFNTSTGCKDNDGASKSDEVPSNPQESTANSSNELSPSERQDLQNKVTKLLAMLDEVQIHFHILSNSFNHSCPFLINHVKIHFGLIYSAITLSTFRINKYICFVYFLLMLDTFIYILSLKEMNTFSFTIYPISSCLPETTCFMHLFF